MRAAADYVKEEHRRSMALVMLVVGWLGMQAWIVWALVVALTTSTPRLPGTLPLWVGPIGIECLLFAITGAMVRSRMRMRDTFVSVFKAGRAGSHIELEQIARDTARQEVALALAPILIASGQKFPPPEERLPGTEDHR